MMPITKQIFNQEAFLWYEKRCQTSLVLGFSIQGCAFIIIVGRLAKGKLNNIMTRCWNLVSLIKHYVKVIK